MIPGGLNTLTVIVLLLTLWHASHALGARRTFAFFAITAVTSWLFEELGVSTGLIYGSYHYTSTLGPLVGSVPVLIPLAWFVLVYPSYLVANLVMDRVPVRIPGDFIGLAVSGALVMTASDLIVDPVLSGPGFRAWVWDTGGRYYGVPAHNYFGWIATAFVIHLVCRSIDRRTMPQLGTALDASLEASARAPRSDAAQWVKPRLVRQVVRSGTPRPRSRPPRPATSGALAFEPSEIDRSQRQ